jgi:YaiO family outer membrane protein
LVAELERGSQDALAVFRNCKILNTMLTLATLLLLLSQAPAPPPADVVAAARAQAAAGRRAEALAALEARLAAVPADTDARTLYGTVLSWEKRYDEARRALTVVLEANPSHADALPALVNVELWTKNFAQAETLAARAVAAMPERADVRVQHARALDGLGRLPEARDALARAIDLNPSAQDIRHYRRTLADRMTRWRAGADYTVEHLSDLDDPWTELQLSAGTQTRAGAFGVRAYDASRFGIEDQQIEIEAYPRFREGTSMYAAVAFADGTSLYPKRRYAADLYQMLGGGFEGTLGMRRLEFDEPTHVYVAGLGKYAGDYLWQARAFYTPGESDSLTWQLGGRRYLADGVSYAGLRYVRGAWRGEPRDLADLDRLNSDGGVADLSLARGRVTLAAALGVSREERELAAARWQTSMTGGLRVRF